VNHREGSSLGGESPTLIELSETSLAAVETYEMSETRDRIRGVLLGLAAGDRIGGPIRMAVRLSESLVDRRQFDPGDILSRYLAWWRDGAFDSGPTTAAVLSLVDGGMDCIEAVKRVHNESGGMTAGCNPAHRCAPLAMASFLPDGELAGCAIREARLTHQHPLADAIRLRRREESPGCRRDPGGRLDMKPTPIGLYVAVSPRLSSDSPIKGGFGETVIAQAQVVTTGKAPNPDFEVSVLALPRRTLVC